MVDIDVLRVVLANPLNNRRILADMITNNGKSVREFTRNLSVMAQKPKPRADFAISSERRRITMNAADVPSSLVGVMIDNYDSFTYNLVQYLRCAVKVCMWYATMLAVAPPLWRNIDPILSCYPPGLLIQMRLGLALT